MASWDECQQSPTLKRVVQESGRTLCDDGKQNGEMAAVGE